MQEYTFFNLELRIPICENLVNIEFGAKILTKFRVAKTPWREGTGGHLRVRVCELIKSELGFVFIVQNYP